MEHETSTQQETDREFVSKNQILLRSGATFVVEVEASDHNSEFIKSYVISKDGTLGTVTCTCTCSSTGKSVSKTCETRQGGLSDCSDPKNPQVFC